MECKIYDAKILFEDHEYWQYDFAPKRNENCSRKWFIQILSLQFPGKRR
jgi:hypothetical protein